MGYNGQERSNDIAGEGNHTTAEFWEYDTRLGRRWNLDPVEKYSQSAYSVLGNNPILMIDPQGNLEYESYDAYKKALGNKALPEKDWKGQDGHWLTFDRTEGTARWDGANTFNITTNNQNQYAPYEQVRDFYSWVNNKSISKGHEVKWMKGAYGLVSKLAAGLQGGSFVIENDVEDLLTKLNIGIQNATLPYFNDLLFGIYSTTPLKGADAQTWDETLVKYEQGQIATPIYAAASKTTITKMNDLANAEFGTYYGLLGFLRGTIPHFNWFNATITTTQARIDIPLLMMYPSTSNLNGVALKTR